MRKFRFLFMSLSLLGAGAAWADSSCEVRGAIMVVGGDPESYDILHPTFATGELEATQFGTTTVALAHSTAIAGGGKVGAYAHAAARRYAKIDYYAQAQAQATLTGLDVLLSGPKGSVTAPLNLDLSGSFANHDPSDSFIGVFVFDYQTAQMGRLAIQNGSVILNTLAPGFTYVEGQTQHIQTIGFGFKGGETNSLLIGAFAQATVQSSEDHEDVSQTVDFGHTLSFSLSQRAFELDGYGVDSPTFNIVDNHFQSVPEPGSMTFLTLGALVAVRKRRISS